jgi:hypothetical protein
VSERAHIADRETGGTLSLDTLQRAVLLPQIETFRDAAREPQTRALYSELRDAVERMEVAPELTERLGAIIEVALSSGRIRKVFGPGAQASLGTLFNRTPPGRRIADSIAALNTALKSLAGQTLEEASASSRNSDSYALSLKTSGCRIVIRFEPSGVRVESLELGLA